MGAAAAVSDETMIASITIITPDREEEEGGAEI